MEEPGLLRIGGAVINLLPLAVTGYKAAVAKGTQMMRNGRTGHVQHRGKIQNAFLAVAQNPENADPVGIAELFKYIGNGLKVFNASDFFLDHRNIYGFSVRMGKYIRIHILSPKGSA